MHLDRLELGLAGVVVGTSILIRVHLVPLMLAILTRGTVIAASLAGCRARRHAQAGHIARRDDGAR